MSIDSDPDTTLSFGEFVIDRGDERLIGPDGPLRLGNKAFQVLRMLVEQNGRLLTKDALFSSVWDGTIVGESSLTSVIKEIRRALRDESRTPRYIESVYGRGYRFIAPVRSESEADPPSSGAPRQSADPPRAARSASQPGQPPLVLVSRFRDEAVRSSHPHCAAELREEVLSGLARVREIRLVADDRPDDEASASRPDERGYQLMATLLPEGDGVKVIARAKRLSDGVIVWADTMSLVQGGTAGGVDRIVRRILGAALPAVGDDVLLGLPRETGDFYESYLIAKRLCFDATTFAEAKAAADALEKIIKERPDFGLAYPPLARLYNTDFGYTAFGSTGPEQRAYALKLAKEGLAADRGNAHAHSLLGWCYFWAGERALSRSAFEQALTLNPYNHVRLEEAATAWMYMNDISGARSLMERAAELNPIPDDNSAEDWGRLHFIEGEYEGARQRLEGITRRSIWAELYLGACEIVLGKAEGKARVRVWRDRVEQSWHSDSVPDQDELLQWVVRHNPLPAGSIDIFLNHVKEGLAGVDSGKSVAGADLQ